MADATISSGTIRMSNSPKVAGWIAFYPAGEDFWLEGHRSPLTPQSPNNGGIAYRKVALTPTGTDPTVFTYPDFPLPPTENATINPSGARWAGYVLDNSATPRVIMHISGLESFRVPSSPSTLNLHDIAGYNTTSLPPVTNGDRLVLGDLYAENGIFSGDVTANAYFGDGSALTGIGTGTGGVLNTGSTTIGADTDSDGVGIVSLQTRTLERLQIANDGTVSIAQTLVVAGLSTFSLGVSIPGAKQLTWTTANVAAPSLTDNTIGSRIKIHDGAAPDHTAIGLESGAGWFNTADANSWKFYYAAVLKHTLTKDVFSLSGALHFLSGGSIRARIESAALDTLSFEKSDGTVRWTIDSDGHFVPTGTLKDLGTASAPVENVNLRTGLNFYLGGVLQSSIVPTAIDQFTFVDGTTGLAKADIRVRNLVASGAVQTVTKAGIPTDSDVTSPASGQQVLDTTNSRIYFRVGSTWKYAALT